MCVTSPYYMRVDRSSAYYTALGYPASQITMGIFSHINFSADSTLFSPLMRHPLRTVPGTSIKISQTAASRESVMYEAGSRALVHTQNTLRGEAKLPKKNPNTSVRRSFSFPPRAHFAEFSLKKGEASDDDHCVHVCSVWQQRRLPFCTQKD